VERGLVTLGFHVILRLFEELADVLLRFTLVLGENLWAIDYFGLIAIKGVRDLTGDKSFTCAWRSVQKHTSNMFNIVFS
jgi:hypothetical protein